MESVQGLKPMCTVREVQVGDQGLWKQSREETEEMVGGGGEDGAWSGNPDPRKSNLLSVDVCGRKTPAILVKGPEPIN
jgi:hypothetical protein